MSLSPRRFLSAAALASLMLTGAACNSGGGSAAAQADGLSAEALQAAAQDEDVRRFYEARQWQPAWTDESADQLRGAFQNAVNHGLDPRTFAQGLDGGGSPAERDVARTTAALAYADALAHGRTDPEQLFEVFELPRNQVDVTAGLAQAVADGNVPQWIEGLAPQDEEYRALSAAYVQHLQAAGQQQGQDQTGGNQAADKGASREEQAKQAPMVPRDRAIVLAANLERRRWLPRQPEGTRIDVNTAANFLRYYRGGQIADQRVVVTGEPGWETPQLGSPLFRLVANPDWTVPQSIEQAELASLGPAQLARRNMARENGRLVQQPGPDNALGLVKFDMRNDHAIYLHDTPGKAAFERPERHLSHGCVRVHDALGFARLIADHNGKRADFDRAQADRSRDTTFIDLGQEIPVRLLYHTAYLDGGRLVFAPDPYGWDAKIAEALGFAVPPASEAARESADEARQRRERDIGP